MLRKSIACWGVGMDMVGSVLLLCLIRLEEYFATKARPGHLIMRNIIMETMYAMNSK